MRALLRLLALALPLALALAPGIGLAHTKSETHSSWQISGSRVRLVFTAPEVEIKRLSKGGAPVTDDDAGAYLAARVGAFDGGRPCRLASGPTPSSAQALFRRFEFVFQCKDGKAIQIRSAAFVDLVPTHVNFAQIQTDKGDFVEQLLTKDRQTLDLSQGAGDDRLQNASFFEYVRLGVMHIFTGVDHMSFLVGLVLISRRLKDLLFVVTGFTIGHSCTLALAVTGVFRPHAEYIDALVALTIALIGAENFAVATHKPVVIAAGLGGLLLAMAALKLFGLGGLPALLLFGAGLFSANYLMISGHLRDAARLRLVVTLVFGLIHGFGFATDLLEMRLPPGRLAELLVGFNLGVELGQVTLVLGILGAVAVLMRAKLALPRPIVVDLTSTYLVGLGVFWFVTRSFA
ncbi:MAG TPA: HupE/UreJ family protein [Caulobacteraceae bacterium]|nr:HupE/UreJ family protein [Caulobacteraceae bacterium]